VATISLTIADIKNGLLTTSFELKDADIERVYHTMKNTYEEYLNQYAGQIDEDTGNPIQAVNLTPKDIVDKLTLDCIEFIAQNVYDNERKLIIKKHWGGEFSLTAK